MVSRLASAAALVASALLVFACSEDKGSLPTETNPQISLSVVPGASCDLKQVKSLANSVYPSKQNTQVGNFLKQLATGSNTAAFRLMDLLSQDVKAGNLANSATASLESDLVVGITNCGTGLVFPTLPTGITDISLAFQANGVFEVRGLNGSVSEDPVFARNGGFSAIQAPGQNFFAWFGGTATNPANGLGAVFGWPLVTEFRTETRQGQGYEYFLIRPTNAALNGKGVVGLCVGDFTTVGNLLQTGGLRIQHAGSVSAPVDPATIQGPTLSWASFNAGVCPPPLTPPPLASLLVQPSPLALLRDGLEWGFRLVQPEAVFAAAARTGSGSGSGSVSPFGVVDADTVILSFTCTEGCKTPASGPMGTLSPQPVVRATGLNGTPLEGVSVTLTVSGNSGSFHFCGTKTQSTDQNGFATFSGLFVDKAGGYTLTATSGYNGFGVSTASSPLFNLGSPQVQACTP